jgi:hypothetical protein
VCAGLSPHQVVFDMVGGERFQEKVRRRVELISTTHIGCLMWCSFALHEAPTYKAEAFNPDIHETFWLGLGTSADPELANHRTPVKNLYITGAAWHPGAQRRVW